MAKLTVCLHDRPPAFARLRRGGQGGGYNDLDCSHGSDSNRSVNGQKIEIFKPFGDAFELTKKILFQPFDLKKWCVIGFAAFLAGHLAGGGFSFPSPFGNFNAAETNQTLNTANLEQWKPWLVIGIAVLGLTIFLLVIVLTWLKARGNFIFTDCIVRNRAAIADPWREYRKEGNSYFLFLLAIMFCSLAMIAVIAAILFSMGLFASTQQQASPFALILLVVFFVILWLCFCIFIGLVSYFMPPVMYRRRCRAMEAFGDVARLVVHRPGPFVLFCLFGIVLVLAIMIIGAIAACATCCLALLPYVGTVILLPMFVCLRAFGLLFLRQFGSEYDVWATLPPPEPIPPPLPA